MIHTCLLNEASLDDIHSHFFTIEIKSLLLNIWRCSSEGSKYKVVIIIRLKKNLHH